MKALASVSLFAAATACLGLAIADPDKEVTIEQGVYGVAYSQPTEDSNVEPYQAQDLVILQQVEEAFSEVARATSTDMGFFEAALDPGAYFICFDDAALPFIDDQGALEARACAALPIVEGERVLRTFVNEPAGRRWLDDSSNDVSLAATASVESAE